jgi:hypothetical protein
MWSHCAKRNAISGTFTRRPEVACARCLLLARHFACVNVDLTVCATADINDLEWAVAAALEIVSLARSRSAALIFDDYARVASVENVIGKRLARP